LIFRLGAEIAPLIVGGAGVWPVRMPYLLAKLWSAHLLGSGLNKTFLHLLNFEVLTHALTSHHEASASVRWTI
jgi:hypothetical protein